MKKSGFVRLGKTTGMRISSGFPKEWNPLFFMSFMASW
jgi:hypothetical protein